MRTNKSGGFTLIELLIVIAIIGILAAVLIPNLLNARARAFDTAATTCLKEIGSQMEFVASNDPFEYDAGRFQVGATEGVDFDSNDDGAFDQQITSCDDVLVTIAVNAAGDEYDLTGEHLRGSNSYISSEGEGVVVAP